jgi:hypothetical protein
VKHPLALACTNPKCSLRLMNGVCLCVCVNGVLMNGGAEEKESMEPIRRKLLRSSAR